MLINFCYGQNNKAKSYVIEPNILSFDKVSNSALLEYPLYDINKNQLEETRTIFGDYVIVSSHSNTESQGGRIFYHQDSDTNWTVIDIEYNQVTIDTINLDGKGKAELILKCKGCSYGSGGGSCFGALIILNTDSIPISLLNVRNYCSEETFAREYGEGVTTEYNNTEIVRPISIKNRIIYISQLDEINRKKWVDNGCELTSIPSGRYQLKNGKIRMLKK